MRPEGTGDLFEPEKGSAEPAASEESAAARYRLARRRHWEQWEMVAGQGNSFRAFYHRRLEHVFRLLIPENSRVLELGCGHGDLLASLKPSHGVGVDFAGVTVQRARQSYPHLHFIEGDVHDLSLDDTFDYIVLSDLVNDLWDVQQVLQKVAALTSTRTRIVLNLYSHLWEQPLKGAQRLGLATPLLEQNWLTVQDMANLFDLVDLEIVKRFEEVLFPVPLWPLSPLLNSFAVKLWPWKYLALTNFLVVRPRRSPEVASPRVSVIVPARNEAGNIGSIIRRIPEMGGGTEIVFVEGHSGDDTFDVIQREIGLHPERNCQCMRQTGEGKGDAVRLGFARARGDILMILDADLTVSPEELPRFYDALVSGKGDFINGVRLVYPMEKQAMRFLNLIGNKVFSILFSWLLGQPIRDTLCGTKVLWKADYHRLNGNRGYFGEFDPFGDFDLLFGAAKLSLKIVEIPVRYRERTYGDTNIKRFRHGFFLLRMIVFAARKLKFV